MKTPFLSRLALLSLTCLGLSACNSEFANGFLVGAGVTIGVVATVAIVSNASAAQSGFVAGNTQSTGYNNYYVPSNRDPVTGRPVPTPTPTPTPRPTPSPIFISRPLASPTPAPSPQPSATPSQSGSEASPAIVVNPPVASSTPMPSPSPSPTASPPPCTSADCPVVIIKPPTTRDAIQPLF